MRIARKLFLLGAMAVMALAATASSAGAAPIEVRTEPGGAHCPAVVLGDPVLGPHAVSGGCHAEFESTGFGIPLHALVAPGVTATVSNCEVRLEARIDGSGEGYVNEATLSAPHGGTVNCTRVPCDEDAGATDTFIPWRVHIEEHGVSNEEVEVEFCLRTLGSAEGTAGLRCEVHLEFAHLGSHNYEAGHLVDPPGEEGTTEFCENNPPNPEAVHPTLPTIISIEPHLVSYGTEKLEVVH